MTPSDQLQPLSFEALREKLLDRLLIILSVLLLPSVALSIWRANLLGWLPPNSLQLVFYCLFLVLIWQRSRLSYPWRAGLFLGLWWLSTVIVFANMGFTSDAKTMLVVESMVAMFLLPSRIGWLVVPLGGITIGAVGVAVLSGIWTLPNRVAYHEHPVGWVISVYHLTALSGVAGYTIWQMVHMLRATLEQSQQRAAQLHSALTRQKAIFASTNAAIGILKAQTFLEANEHLAELLGYRHDELIGRPIGLLHLDADHDAAFDRQVYPQLREAGHCALEYPLRRKDGSPIWMYLSISALEEETALVGIDVTELRRARDAAEAANQAKTAFLANMSHELRTPLNAMLGYAQVLDAELRPDDPNRRYADSIRRGGDHLLALINDILDLAKIEDGRIVLKPTAWSPGTFFQELIDLFQGRAEEKGLGMGLNMTGDMPGALRCDLKRLRQILVNLLGNAIKFTPEGRVSLKAGFAEGQLRVQVTDTGIGIAPEHLQRIFERFEQVGSEKYMTQGSGLGLTISRRLAEMMGGILGAESIPGKGSTFYLAIPVETVPTEEIASSGGKPPAVPRRERAPAAGGGHVLVVDDVELNRRLLADLLAPCGFTVEEAEDGRRCIEQVRRHPPDIILMDMRMPEMDGLTATRELRELGIQVPIVMLSASAFDADRQASLDGGCQAFLSKPIAADALIETLARVLQPSQQGRAGATPSSENEPSEAGIADTGDEALIDRNLLNDHATALRPKALIRALHDFGRQGGETLRKLTAALRDNQSAAAAASAHRLAGTAGMLGLRALTRLSLEIEGHAATMTAQELSKVADEVEALFRATLTELATYIERVNGRSEGEIDGWLDTDR